MKTEEQDVLRLHIVDKLKDKLSPLSWPEQLEALRIDIDTTVESLIDSHLESKSGAELLELLCEL